ncbi:MAG TPA: HDOD domain-containing protein [Planctomycetaceae bacterium]|jgi:DNA-binding response OmpR family regulator|nr:HDOD domain-containing protein [Planctomycetaceae bacterium]
MNVDSPAKPRALVVDDEQSVRSVVSMALSYHGIDSETAQSGNEAQTLVDTKHYDLVVTDLRMPDGHGHRLCTSLLEQKERPVVVVLTGVIEPRLHEDLRVRGIDAIFFKPVNFEEFAQQVQRLMHERASGAVGPQCALTTSEVVAGSGPAIPPLAAAQGTSSPVSPVKSGPQRKSPAGNCAAILGRDGAASYALANALQSRGIEAVPVASADGLYRMLKERRANLYVIDNQLDGAFSGFEILTRLRKQWPNVPAVLIDAAASPEAEKARAMTGVTLIPSSGNTNDIAQKLAAVTVRNQVVISKAARELVERQHNLPVMSRLVSRLVEYLGMTPDEVSLSELCRELTLDPKAALLVLKAANASSNGVSREIVNVQDAIRLLGVQRALGHVLASTVTDGTEELAKGVLGEQRKWHARRGILTAITASTFAEKLEDRSSETGRLFGILQDVGILLFLRQYPDQYVALLRRWRTSGHLKLAALEQMELGCTHAEVSAALLDYWDMPGAIIHPVMHHLESTPNAVRLGVDPGLHRAMSIAEALVDSIDAPHPTRRVVLDQLLANYGAAQRSACLDSIATAVRTAYDAFQLLDARLPSPADLETMVRSALKQSSPSGQER